STETIASSPPSCHGSHRMFARSQMSKTSSIRESTRLRGSVLTRGSCSPSCSGFGELLGKGQLLRRFNRPPLRLDRRAELTGDRSDLGRVILGDLPERLTERGDDQ